MKSQDVIEQHTKRIKTIKREQDKETNGNNQKLFFKKPNKWIDANF